MKCHSDSQLYSLGRFGNAKCPLARAILVPSSKALQEVLIVEVQSKKPMLNGRQCSGASTTGRTVHEFGDHAAFRSHHHSLRLPLPPSFKCSASLCNRPCQPSNLSRRQKLSLQASPGSRRHRQQRQCHKPITACAATSAQSEPNHGRLPSLLRKIRTAVVLAAIFGIWCCISANTQPSSAFMSVTSALTDAGAPPAGERPKNDRLLVR